MNEKRTIAGLNIATYILCFYAVSIPTSIFLNSISLIIIVLYTAFLIYNKTLVSLNTQWVILLPIGFYILDVVGLTYGDDFSGLNHLVLHLPFVIIPVAVMVMNLNVKEIIFIFSNLVFICVVMLLVCYIYNFWNYFETGSFFIINDQGNREFLLFYTSLMRPFALHPSYFSLYLSFNIIILLVVGRVSRLGFGYKVFLNFLILFHFLFVLQLTSRGVILGLFSACIFYGFYDLITEFYFRKIVTYIVIIAAVLVLIMSLPYTKTRMKVLYGSLIEGANKEANHSANSRLIIWQAALNVVKQSPIYGHGTAKGQSLLQNEYRRMNFNQGIQKNFNSHNQWLELLISFGLIGLIFFALLFVMPFFVFKLKVEHWLPFILFLLLILISFASENFLSRQKGVVFFVFSYCLVVKYLYLKSDEYHNEKGFDNNNITIL